MELQLPGADDRTLQAAHMLIAAGWLCTPEDVCYFFAKPHKYEEEVRMWREAGSPGPEDAGWDLLTRRLDTNS